MKEHATNTRQRILVRLICFFWDNSFLLTVGIRSTATAEAEVSTTDSRVDMDAERRSIIITARRMIPAVPPPSTCISRVGITESIPPAGSVPPRMRRDVLPTRYAPQPITMQKMVEMTVPRLMAEVSLMA